MHVNQQPNLRGNLSVAPRYQHILDAIPAIITGIIALLCGWALFNAPILLSWITLIWVWYLVARIIFALYAHWHGLKKIHFASQQDWRALYQQQVHQIRWEDVHHIVLLPNDHESLTVLQSSLTRLSQSPEALRMTVVLAMEAREAEAIAKATQLQTEFSPHFARILITYHPEGLAGEIRCKSANIRYAIQQTKHLLEAEYPSFGTTIVTAMDADTLWHPHYFSALTYYFITDKDRYITFWQAPIRYHGKIELVPHALRLVNIYASALELAYLASWWFIMPISSYSASFTLLEAHDFWDKDAIAEEWRMFLKAYFGENGQTRTKPIFLPFTATVVQGANFWNALKNRYYQTVRHALGSKEIGYAIYGMFTAHKTPLIKRLRIVGRVSHDIMAGGAGWVILILGGQGVGLVHGLAVYQANWTIFIGIQLAFIMLTVLAIIFWMVDNMVKGERIIPNTRREIVLMAMAFVMFPFLTVILLALPVFHAQLWLLLGLPLSFRVSPKTI